MDQKLIYVNDRGQLEFGDYTLNEKSKVPSFEMGGDSYYLKTWKEITRLEKNGLFLLEALPGCRISAFEEKEDETGFTVSAPYEVHLTIGVDESADYTLLVGGVDRTTSMTRIGGKLAFTVPTKEGEPVDVLLRKHRG